MRFRKTLGAIGTAILLKLLSPASAEASQNKVFDNDQIVYTENNFGGMQYDGNEYDLKLPSMDEIVEEDAKRIRNSYAAIQENSQNPAIQTQKQAIQKDINGNWFYIMPSGEQGEVKVTMSKPSVRAAVKAWAQADGMDLVVPVREVPSKLTERDLEQVRQGVRHAANLANMKAAQGRGDEPVYISVPYREVDVDEPEQKQLVLIDVARAEKNLAQLASDCGLFSGDYTRQDLVFLLARTNGSLKAAYHAFNDMIAEPETGVSIGPALDKYLRTNDGKSRRAEIAFSVNEDGSVDTSRFANAVQEIADAVTTTYSDWAQAKHYVTITHFNSLVLDDGLQTLTAALSEADQNMLAEKRKNAKKDFNLAAEKPANADEKLDDKLPTASDALNGNANGNGGKFIGYVNDAVRLGIDYLSTLAGKPVVPAEKSMNVRNPADENRSEKYNKKDSNDSNQNASIDNMLPNASNAVDYAAGEKRYADSLWLNYNVKPQSQNVDFERLFNDEGPLDSRLDSKAGTSGSYASSGCSPEQKGIISGLAGITGILLLGGYVITQRKKKTKDKLNISQIQEPDDKLKRIAEGRKDGPVVDAESIEGGIVVPDIKTRY